MKKLLIGLAVGVALAGLIFGGVVLVDRVVNSHRAATATPDPLTRADVTRCANVKAAIRVRERLKQNLDTDADALAELRPIQLRLERAERELGTESTESTARIVATARDQLSGSGTSVGGYELTARTLAVTALSHLDETYSYECYGGSPTGTP